MNQGPFSWNYERGGEREMVTSTIIPIVYQTERDFPNLTIKGARGLDVQVSLNQLFEDH